MDQALVEWTHFTKRKQEDIIDLCARYERILTRLGATGKQLGDKLKIMTLQHMPFKFLKQF